MKNENKLIAEFMGYAFVDGVYESSKDEFHIDEMLYDTSWDWLKPVVDKIEQVNKGVPQQMLHVNLYSEIGEVYKAVVEFIKTYKNK